MRSNAISSFFTLFLHHCPVISAYKFLLASLTALIPLLLVILATKRLDEKSYKFNSKYT